MHANVLIKHKELHITALDMKSCQQQNFSSVVAIDRRKGDCGIKFIQVKVYIGLLNKTAALILNISNILKFLVLLR